MSGPVDTPRRIGRFELTRLLGRGAQASVWLAHDPRLQREVALKCLEGGADPAALSEWMHEAHAVSRLKHPNVVPLFEVDDSSGRPSLVFEYVDGGTVAELLRRDGAMPARRAVELMIGVLDALAEAHRQGIVHRDLKPSNVLLGKDGRARVMDFGIAARMTGVADGRIVGTAGYLSPEAARGEAPSPRMDVFSAGVMLAELLCGRRPLAETDPLRALERVQREDLTLPADVEIDDGLRSLVQRAMSRDPAQRPDSASALRDSLSQWLESSGGGAPDRSAGGAAGHGTLEFLLRRMRHKSDFPALGEAVSRIQRAANSDTESLQGLAEEILRDVALTNKLLRLVNSAHFRHAGGGTIGTVSRAVALIGFAGVRNLAMSLVLLEHMQNKRHASQLQDEFLRAMMAGSVAGSIAPVARESEEVFIGALFQSLGRLLTEFYFPEEAQQIRQLREQGQDLEVAAQRVLGIGLQDLAAGVAKAWGLPETLQKVMRPPLGEAMPRAVPHGVERQRWIGRCANEITDCMLAHAAPEEAARAVAALAERHARVLGLQPRDLTAAAHEARERLVELSRLLGVAPDSGALSRRLFPPRVESTGVVAADDRTMVLEPPRASPDGAADATPSAPHATVPAPRDRVAVTNALTAGIAEVTQSLALGEFKLNELLHKVLETMHGALGLQRVVLCLRDPRTESLIGRLSLGKGAPSACKPFVIPLRDQAGVAIDLFSAVCRKGVDTVISDTSRGDLRSRLPAWYLQSVNAPSFLLLPLMMRHAPFGLIYADAAQPGALDPEEKELVLLRALRNQVVMAFRQVDRG